MVVTWSDLAKHCPWSKGQPIGNGIYCAPWHSASSYPIEGEFLFLCGFIAIIIIRAVVVVKVGQISDLLLKLSQ